MLGLWGCIAGLLLYLEAIYHISGFGVGLGNPLFVILTVLFWSAVETLVVGCLKGKAKMISFQIFLWFSIVWTGAQVVYLHIFKQPLLWEAIFCGAQDALTNYWRDALTGFLEVFPFILLLLLPGVGACLLLGRKKCSLPQFGDLQFLRMVLGIVVCLAAGVIHLAVGKAIGANYYENYEVFFDPLTVVEEMGVHSTLQRDTVSGIQRIAENLVVSVKAKGNSEEKPVLSTEAVQPADAKDGEEKGNATESGGAVATGNDAEAPGSLSGSASESSEPSEETGQDSTRKPETSVPEPHEFALDYEKLAALAENKKQAWLAEYIQSQKPTMTNEYTGLFEGYNLIFLTAEGFSPYAVREDLTPTLFHMVHSGFVFENYYVPLWQTSTSDGEYINCTGLIPDGQFSMKKSASNRMPFTLAGFFNRTGVQSLAYHNNNLSYYDRYLTHPNLGYLFKACNLGGLDREEYGQYLFEMEGADRWPASDYEMMVSTMPEYVERERFLVYYMTVSGHMNYNFQGNSMSLKNRDAVKDLEMSENAQAYIACNIELDKALEYLLQQLKEAGQLERTVIALSADHYPYPMTQEQYEELAGRNLDEGKELYRNHLILWNAAYEEEPVTVKKACGSMDLVPTLLNLFGFAYDSRMYAGRDIFSDTEGMVIFNDRSFVTDGLIYNRKKREAVWLKNEEGKDIVPEEEREAYLEAKQQEVRERYQFSAYVLQEDYYKYIEQAIARK